MAVRSNKYYLHSVITILLMFGMKFVPPIEGITDTGMGVLGVFLGAIYGWCFVELVWPSIVALIALAFTGYTSLNGAFIAGFGNYTVIVTAACLIFAQIMVECKLTDAIAGWFLTRKIVVGRPHILLLMIMLAAYFISATANIFAGILLLWNITYNLAEKINLPKQSPYITEILVAVVYAGVLGQMLFPFMAAPTIFLNFLLKELDVVSINYLGWILYYLLFSAAAISLFLLFSKFVLKPDTSALQEAKNLQLTYREKLTKEQQIGGGLLIGIILALCLPNIIPTLPCAEALSSLGLIGVMSSGIVIAALIQVDQKAFINIIDVCKKGISWDIIWLLAATIPLGDALESDQTGIVATFIGYVLPYLNGMGPYLFAVISMLTLGLMTQVAHNVILAAVFIPALTQIYLSMSGNPMVLFMLLLPALSMALMTPGGCPQAAMLHGNREWISAKSAYGFGLLCIGLVLITGAIIGYPLASMIF